MASTANKMGAMCFKPLRQQQEVTSTKSSTEPLRKKLRKSLSKRKISDDDSEHEYYEPPRKKNNNFIEECKNYPSREGVNLIQDKVKARNKRMFRSVMETLNKFQKEEERFNEKKAEIQKSNHECEFKKKLDILKKENELLMDQKKEGQFNDKVAENHECEFKKKLDILKKENELLMEFKRKVEFEYQNPQISKKSKFSCDESQKLSNFFVTKSKPHIKYMPKHFSDVESTQGDFKRVELPHSQLD